MTRQANKLFNEPFPLTGPVKINRDAVMLNFANCKIVQHGASFRLHGEDFAATLHADDALWIIDTMKLAACSTQVMRRVVVWKE